MCIADYSIFFWARFILRYASKSYVKPSEKEGAQLHLTTERLCCTDSKVWSSNNWDNRCTFYKSYCYKTTEKSFDPSNQLTSKRCTA